MTVKVFAPASIGNVSVGFDVLGMAIRPISNVLLGDIVSVGQSDCEHNQVFINGQYAHKLPQQVSDNIVFSCLQRFERALQQRDIETMAVELCLTKAMPVGSGLGSSACSIVAALMALNEFYQNPFNDAQLLSMMGEMEEKISGSLHYDNVAPCFHGGLQLMVGDRQKICQTLPALDGVYWIMAYPGVEVSTRAAREALPEHYPRHTVIEFGTNLASFVDACHRRDTTQALSYVTDVLAEPYRLELIPKAELVKNYVLDNGALAAGISGSGPTLFVACDTLLSAQQLAAYLTAHYLQSDAGFVHICQADVQGARVI
ncbi:homoserine kinase [Thalassotalea ponticola]|uniref:homoserine kinase n=1 Tax=Thalassotalea ponticola TaxID=1523392 RepID=UPI0025B32584|nr:homoserine kinase [Thalassotalea ponticola]MDN3652040.1 homoserine kinase [Thalassotalea ponticola]